MIVELAHHRQTIFARARHTQFSEREAQQLNKGEMRVEDTRGLNVGLQAARQAFQQRGFTSPGLSGNDHEALPRIDAITQSCECFFVARIHEEKPRVRSHVKWRLCEAEMLVIHSSSEW